MSTTIIETETVFSRPDQRFVNILTTLTFIGSVVGFVFALMYVMMYNNLEPVIQKGIAAQGQNFDVTTKEGSQMKQAQDTYFSFRNTLGEERFDKYLKQGNLDGFFRSYSHHYMVVAASNLLSFFAALWMRSYKKKGFYVYVFSVVLFMISPFLTIWDYRILWLGTFTFAGIGLAFIFLYSRVIKHFG